MNKESLIDFSNYEISEDGSIYSKSYNKNRELKGYIEKKGGYVKVNLKCTDGKQRLFQWNRVIWYYFNGEIPEGMQVNHIDECKTNNALSNFNLLTQGENNNWGTRNERSATSNKLTKTKNHILQYNLKTGEPIKEWFNAVVAAKELGFDFRKIYQCCEGRFFDYKSKKWFNKPQYKGFGWRYIKRETE